jgi:hypothetical protein
MTNERKTEKRHECTNIGQLKTTRIVKAAVCQVAFDSRSVKLQAS